MPVSSKYCLRSYDTSLYVMWSFGDNIRFRNFMIFNPIQYAGSSSIFEWCGQDFVCIIVVDNHNIVVTSVLLTCKLPGKTRIYISSSVK